MVWFNNTNIRTKSSKSLNEYIKDEIDKLTIKIKQNKNIREESTNEIVKALCHYTAALHDGVRIVSEAT